MREETYKGVGDWRIKLAEDELVPYIAKQLENKGGDIEMEEEAKDSEVVVEPSGEDEMTLEDKEFMQEHKDDDDN